MSRCATRAHILYPVRVLNQPPLGAGRAAELLLQDQDASVDLIFLHSLNVLLQFSDAKFLLRNEKYNNLRNGRRGH